MFEIDPLVIKGLVGVVSSFGIYSGGTKFRLCIGSKRAIALFFGSKNSVLPSPRSVRASQVAQLKGILNSLNNVTDGYIVVRGAKGIGKTCLINSALHEVEGVVRVTIPAGMSQTDLTNKPVIVLTMSERTNGMKFAEVTGAVRDLTSRGVRIVIDSCPNSLPPELLNTERESVIEVNELSSDEIRALPQLQELFRTLGDKLALTLL